MLSPFLYALLIILPLMTLVYIIALIKDDYSVIDIFWPLGLLIVALLILDRSQSLQQNLVIIFVTIWSVRLCPYLFYRIMNKGPDQRYKELQMGWGKNHRIHAFFKIYMLQGFLMYLVSMPILATPYVSSTNSFLLWLGSILCIVGIGLESYADYRIWSFKRLAENKGKYIMDGIFKYSRHPNYLGESLMWIGIAFIALPNTFFILPFLGPAVLIYCLYNFTGVPYAERNRKGEAFREYVENTGAIFPRLFK